MSGPLNFTARERERFRKLLEVAHSTTYEGEKDAALAAATRLARSRGMSLHNAAGMKDDDLPRRQSKSERNRRAKTGTGANPILGDTFRAARGSYHNQTEHLRAEKHRYEQAMADAIRRGLRFDEDRAVNKRLSIVRRAGIGAWRSRPDFIRVLLRETRMSAREIAATVGVSVHDVFKEKLLMRQA